MKFRYYTTPSYEFIDYSTKYTWIKFGSGGDSGTINSKTSNPSNLYLEISILYRIREENLHDIYKKWPTKNNFRDYVLFAKVIYNWNKDASRMLFKKYLKIFLTTTSSPRESISSKLWQRKSTRSSPKTTPRSLLSLSQMSSLTKHSKPLSLINNPLKETLRPLFSSKLLTSSRVRSVLFNLSMRLRWRKSRLKLKDRSKS